MRLSPASLVCLKIPQINLVTVGGYIEYIMHHSAHLLVSLAPC